MTAGVYTTTVDILGGPGSVSEWGDLVEDGNVLLANVPALIVADRRIVVPEGGREAIAVRYYTGRLPHGTVVDDTHRLRDNGTGRIYLVDHVEQPVSPVTPQDIQLDLRHVS